MQSPPAPQRGGAERLRLADFLPYRLSVLSNTISGAIAAQYQHQFGLTIWQWRVMAVIGETPGLTASQVTERTAMDKVAVSRAVSALEAGGHVIREKDRSDARASRLSLSPAGKAIYRRIVPLARSYESTLIAGLTDAECETLASLMDKLARAASPDQPLW